MSLVQDFRLYSLLLSGVEPTFLIPACSPIYSRLHRVEGTSDPTASVLHYLSSGSPG